MYEFDQYNEQREEAKLRREEYQLRRELQYLQNDNERSIESKRQDLIFWELNEYAKGRGVVCAAWDVTIHSLWSHGTMVRQFVREHAMGFGLAQIAWGSQAKHSGYCRITCYETIGDRELNPHWKSARRVLEYEFLEEQAYFTRKNTEEFAEIQQRRKKLRPLITRIENESFTTRDKDEYESSEETEEQEGPY